MGPGAAGIRWGATAAVAALLLGLAGAGSHAATDASAQSPAVVSDARGVEATLRVSARCEASLSRSRADGRALRYRNECEPELSANLRTLATLLAALFEGPALPPEVDQLDAGRLVMTWPELALRLALAARESPEWDAARARRDDGFANRFVRELADRRRVFAELDGLLGRPGRRVAVGSVEKVLIGTPAQTPIAPALRAAGVADDERLPFDAQLWLRLPPAAPGGGD